MCPIDAYKNLEEYKNGFLPQLPNDFKYAIAGPMGWHKNNANLGQTNWFSSIWVYNNIYECKVKTSIGVFKFMKKEFENCNEYWIVDLLNNKNILDVAVITVIENIYVKVLEESLSVNLLVDMSAKYGNTETKEIIIRLKEFVDENNE